MTHDQIIEKARWYAEHIKLTPSYFRRQLNAQERALFDEILITHRRVLVEGKNAKFSPSFSLRSHSA